MTTALHKLEHALRDMVKAEDEGHPPEPWEIRMVARPLEEQAHQREELG